MFFLLAAFLVILVVIGFAVVLIADSRRHSAQSGREGVDEVVGTNRWIKATSGQGGRG